MRRTRQATSRPPPGRARRGQRSPIGFGRAGSARCHSTVVLQFAQAAAGPGSRQGAPLPVQSVLEVPPALAEPAAALVGAALLGLLTIARQSADRLFEPPLGLLARAFRSLL